jgi:hypothetical protein
MTFTLEQALRAQQALRKAAALPKEQFPIEAFIGMLSDEIEVLRSRGMMDEEIAALINDAAPAQVSPSAIADNYAPPEQRHRQDR